MKTTRVEKHIIYPKNSHYKLLDEFCFKSKNLYNFANYTIRQSFCNDGKYISYYDMCKNLTQSGNDFDFRNIEKLKDVINNKESIEKFFTDIAVQIGKDYECETDILSYNLKEC